jgi:hypothetical protein
VKLTRAFFLLEPIAPVAAYALPPPRTDAPRPVCQAGSYARV